MLKYIFILFIVLPVSACSKQDTICTGDTRLEKVKGSWALASFADDLARTRSWYDAMKDDITPVASLRVNGKAVNFNLNWHEGDSGKGHCMRIESDRLWARPNWEKKWFGPYIRFTGSEDTFFLGKFFTGCFTSDTAEKWCLSASGITVNGERLEAKLQKDITEGPLYGTAFAVKGRPYSFIVFVPRGNGWAIFEDDWASNETRTPVDPIKDKPWRTLTP